MTYEVRYQVHYYGYLALSLPIMSDSVALSICSPCPCQYSLFVLDQLLPVISVHFQPPLSHFSVVSSLPTSTPFLPLALCLALPLSLHSIMSECEVLQSIYIYEFSNFGETF